MDRFNNYYYVILQKIITLANQRRLQNYEKPYRKTYPKNF